MATFTVEERVSNIEGKTEEISLRVTDTRQEFIELRKEMKQIVLQLHERMDTGFKELRTEMTTYFRWGITILFTTVSIAVAIIRLFL